MMMERKKWREKIILKKQPFYALNGFVPTTKNPVSPQTTLQDKLVQLIRHFLTYIFMLAKLSKRLRTGRGRYKITLKSKRVFANKHAYAIQFRHCSCGFSAKQLFKVLRTLMQRRPGKTVLHCFCIHFS